MNYEKITLETFDIDDHFVTRLDNDSDEFEKCRGYRRLFPKLLITPWFESYDMSDLQNATFNDLLKFLPLIHWKQYD